jgi:hypothetical protein
MYLSRRRRLEREAHERAAQAERAARSGPSVAGADLRRGVVTPSESPMGWTKASQKGSR